MVSTMLRQRSKSCNQHEDTYTGGNSVQEPSVNPSCSPCDRHTASSNPSKKFNKKQKNIKTEHNHVNCFVSCPFHVFISRVHVGIYESRFGTEFTFCLNWYNVGKLFGYSARPFLPSSKIEFEGPVSTFGQDESTKARYCET